MGGKEKAGKLAGKGREGKADRRGGKEKAGKLGG
jgi:hypothetical protein